MIRTSRLMMTAMSVVVLLAFTVPAEAAACPPPPIPDLAWLFLTDCYHGFTLSGIIGCALLHEGLAWNMINDWHGELIPWLIDCAPVP